MDKRQKLFLALGIDVEEEGLFGGRYICQSPQISNTAHLHRLIPILEKGIKPTLFCAYSAFADAPSRKALAALRDSYNAEIAAHLHHWSTPPLQGAKMRILNKVPASKVSDLAIGAKLDNLLQIAQDFQGAPITAFRMGRWDLHARLWPILAERGIVCDASIRPLHYFIAKDKGPDHFDAPAEPYLVETGKGSILEIPLTVTPVGQILARVFPSRARHLRASLRYWGALALLPIQHPLWLLKLTTLLHARRGGATISLTWHSSEMMPKGAPHMPDMEAVKRFMDKINAYLDWLYDTFNVTSVTMSQLRQRLGNNVPCPASPLPVDWTYGACQREVS